MDFKSTSTRALPRPEAVLQARGVCVRFAGVKRDAVRDVSFRLEPGETLALLGPSGSGKSTLALAILGAIPELIPGHVSGDIVPRARRAGDNAAAVLQDTDAQLVALTVEDEIAFALENRGLPASDIDCRIDVALARPPTRGLSRRDRTLELSGGWRQRLAIGAALAQEEPLLVMDEPFAHLQTQATEDTLNALLAAARRRTAVILIEHRAEQAARLAQDILVLSADGRPAILAPARVALYELAWSPGAHGLRVPAVVRVAAALQHAGLLSRRERPLTEEELVRGLAPSLADPAVVPTALRALALRALKPAASVGAPMLSLEQASLRRSGRLVLDAVTLAVAPGEVVGLTGPNGAGKTSLALLAAGAFRPSMGQVRQVARAAPVYVPQNPSLAFASGSLGDEARRRGLAWSRAAAAIAAAGLPADATRHPLAFSHGERRRLALAFATAAPEPRLIILDEPISGLDQAAVDAIDRDVQLLRERGCAILIIAHDLDWLAAISDRIAVIAQGLIAALDSPSAILRLAVQGALPVGVPEGARLASRLGWSGGPTCC
jgi:energy-coupling factor transport system ATP-binding protein